MKEIKKLLRKIRKREPKIIEFLSDKDYKKIKECEKPFHKAIMLFIANTGLRLAELQRLTFSDVYLPNWSIKHSLRVRKGEAGIFFRDINLNITAKDCIKVFYEEAKKRLSEKLNFESPLIISKKASRLTREHLATILRNFAWGKNIEKLTPLMLRDYFAVSLVKAGLNLKAIKDIMGYRSIVTTHDRYGNTSSEHIQEHVDKIG